jgi:nucleotide-binding universal stress UspA family protein
MTKLLLPVDGSPSALRAAEFLVRFVAGQPATSVVLLHVHSPVMAWEISPYVTAEMVRQLHEQAGHDAVKGARSVLDAGGITCEEHLLAGDPAQVIANVAAEERVDAIVMGTRGMGPIKSLVLGSVATKVVHLADVPVTLVKCQGPLLQPGHQVGDPA